jgi:endogenous inhibitor of DNA gyrase (YacG/DUF329 family)
MNKVLKVKCANCKKKFNYYDSEFRPFCCEKCKMIDLGHWLNEEYTVPVTKNPESHPEVDEFEIDDFDQGLGSFDGEEHKK